MAPLLRNTFSTNEKMVSQCDNQALRSTVEMLIIQFKQEKFKQLLSTGKMSPLSMCKRRKIAIAKAPLVDFGSKSQLRLARLHVSLLQPQARLNKLHAILSTRLYESLSQLHVELRRLCASLRQALPSLVWLQNGSTSPHVMLKESLFS